MNHEAWSDDDKYQYWRTDAGRNTEKMARDLGLPGTTVATWCSRGRWRARSNAEDLRDFGDIVAWARFDTVKDLYESRQVLRSGLRAVHDEQGRPAPGSPTPSALKVARDNLATFGIVPQKHTIFESREGEQASVAAIAAILESEDHDALLALLQGAPPPEKYTAIEATVIDSPTLPAPHERPQSDPAQS